jgi:hypothetical protein
MTVKKHILSCSVALPHKTRNNTTGSILTVKGITQLLASRVVLLFEGERLEDKRVPFILQGSQQRGYGRVSRRPRNGRTRTLKNLSIVGLRGEGHTYWL